MSDNENTVADISIAGDAVAVKYIHVRSYLDFKVNEIMCFTLERVMENDFDNNYPYYIAQDGEI